MADKKHFGFHFLVDFVDCDAKIISTVEPVREVALSAVRDCGATMIDHLFHQFEPHGVSGTILIAESHFAIHTWPEDAFAGADIFTCGEDMKPEVAIEIMKKGFRAREIRFKKLIRGRLLES